MLHEFALDPTVMNTWEKFRYFFEKFGVEYGRLISQFPKKWKRMVIQSCREQGTKRTRLVERLRSIDGKLIRSGRFYDGQIDWLKNAEDQHSMKPFHAIISSSNPRKQPFILIDDELDETNPLWKVKREDVIPRTAEDIASCCTLLLQISKEILFVDPHYNPAVNSRWHKPIKLLLEYAYQREKQVRLELHVEGEDNGIQTWLSNCKEYLHSLIPCGFSLKVFVWEKQAPVGDKLHPRYILTDRGGIRIEYGLDEGKPGETTDISLLSHSLYERRWKDYQKETTNFKFVGEIVIVGTREI